MAKKRQPSAHELVQPAVEGLIARIRSAAQRVVASRNDPEAIHDFRVGLRRLRTVLRASRRLYGKEHVKPLEQRFKTFGDATSALRDEEVLDETVAGVEIEPASRERVAAWLRARSAREAVLRNEAVVLVNSPALDESFDALLALVAGGPKRDDGAEAFAERCLESARVGVHELLPVRRHDVDALHRLRIRFKRLRYTAEMLGRFMTHADASEALRVGGRRHHGPNYAAVARLAARMQKVLGLLHDADQARITVSDTDGLDSSTRLELLAALTKLREQLVDEAIARLQDLPEELFGRALQDE